MKKVIETFYCDLCNADATVVTQQFSLVEDVATKMKLIVAHEYYRQFDKEQLNAYSFAVFEEKYRVNLADLFEKAGISLNKKNDKIYKTKGLPYYAIDCSSKKEAVATFIMERIGVTEGDIEEYYGEIPEGAAGVYSFDGVKIFNK